jgi:hypothetical protein
VGDDAAEGKSARALLRQWDTRAHGGDIYARGQKTLVHRDLDKDRDRLEEENQVDQVDPASHHDLEDREGQEGQEGHYRQEG